MANVKHNLHRSCEISDPGIISSLSYSDCEDDCDSDLLLFLQVNHANVSPKSRPPNFRKSQVRRHFEVADKKEIIASTPVNRIRKRKSESPSEKSISLSPIEKNSVLACHLISAKKPRCQGEEQFAEKYDNIEDDPAPQLLGVQENGKVTSPTQDVEVITKKKRFSSIKTIKDDDELEKRQIKEKMEGTATITKEVSILLTPMVKLVKLPSNVMNPTVNKSIQLSCKKKRLKKEGQIESNKIVNGVENCHDLENGEGLAGKFEKNLQRRTLNTPEKRVEINEEAKEDCNDNIAVLETNDNKQDKVESNMNGYGSERSGSSVDSLQPLVDQIHNDIKKYNNGDNNALKDNFFGILKGYSENMNIDVESAKRSFFRQLYGVEAPQENILQTLKKTNRKDSPISDKRDGINETKEHHTSNKLRPKKLFSSDRIENDEPPEERNKSPAHNIIEKSVQYQEKADASAIDEIGNITSDRIVVKATNEDPLFVECNNVDLDKENKNRTTRSRSIQRGDVEKFRKSESVREKSEVRMNKTREQHEASVNLRSNNPLSLGRIENKEPSVEGDPLLVESDNDDQDKENTNRTNRSRSVKMGDFEKFRKSESVREKSKVPMKKTGASHEASVNLRSKNPSSLGKIENKEPSLEEDPLLVECNNVDQDEENKNRTTRNRSIKRGDVEKFRKSESVREKSEVPMKKTGAPHEASVNLRSKNPSSLGKIENKEPSVEEDPLLVECNNIDQDKENTNRTNRSRSVKREDVKKNRESGSAREKSKVSMNKTGDQREASVNLRSKNTSGLGRMEDKKPFVEGIRSDRLKQVHEKNASVNNDIDDITSERNIINTRSENTENKNVRSTTSRTAKSGDDKKKRKSSTKRKSGISEKESLNEINVVKRKSKRKTIETTLDDKIVQVENIHETRTSVTTKSKINNANINHNNEELPKVSKNTGKSIHKEVNKTQDIKQKVKKSSNEKENTKLTTRKSTSKRPAKDKYVKALRDLLDKQHYVNSSEVSSQNMDQSTIGERRSSRARKQTKTYALETIIVTERQFLSYCGMKAKNRNYSKRSKKSVEKTSDNTQNSQFKVPTVPPPSSKKKSKRNDLNLPDPKPSDNVQNSRFEMPSVPPPSSKKKSKRNNSKTSNIPDSGNFSMTPSRSLQMPRPSVDDNIMEVLPEDTNKGLENDSFLPPIIEENIDVMTDFRNNDNTKKNASRLHYNLRNTSSERAENNNKTQHNTEKNSDQTHVNYRVEEPAHQVDEPPQKVQSNKKSSRNTKKRQSNNTTSKEKHRDIDQTTERYNSKIEILGATVRGRSIDKEYSKKNTPETINVTSDAVESDHSLTMLPANDNCELNYVVKYCARRAACRQKKPELNPVNGQQGIYLGYSVNNLDLGYCSFSVAVMEFDPNCFKKQCYFKTSHGHYTVIEGEAEVTLGQRKMRLGVDESFFVPLGQDYSIKNTSSTEKLRLSFINVKAPKFPP